MKKLFLLVYVVGLLASSEAIVLAQEPLPGSEVYRQAERQLQALPDSVVNPPDGARNPPDGARNPPGIGPITTLINPLGVNSIEEFFLKIIQIVIIFAIPIIVFFIMLAGFKYVTARGNMEQVKEATTALTWALVGGVLILGAQAILEIIKGTIAAIR